MTSYDEYFVGRHTTRAETGNAPILTQVDGSNVVGELTGEGFGCFTFYPFAITSGWV